MVFLKVVILIACRSKLSRPTKDWKASAAFNSVKPEMTDDKSYLDEESLKWSLRSFGVFFDVLYMCFSVHLVIYAYRCISIGQFLIVLDPFESV